MSDNKVCFIIALKYYRNYPTHIKEYVDSINKFYNNSFILIVDNNSTYIEDIKFEYNNVIIITNTSDSKFEMGAYNFGINYIIENNLTDNYEYYIFTQDTFILHNKYDFNNLLNNNITACPIVGSKQGTFANDLKDCMGHHRGHKSQYLIKYVIMKLQLTESIPDLTFCFANSFVLYKSKLNEFNQLTNYIKITNKTQSESSERFLAGVLYLLNDKKNTSIEDTLVENVFHLIKVGSIIRFEHFIKYIESKNESS